MAIAPTDIALMLSVPSASGGAITAQANPTASLGKYVSTTALSTTAMNNLFDNITGAQNAASSVEYRCIFVQNNHATLTALNCAVWISSQVSGGAVCQVGVDATAASAKAATSAQAVTSASESTAPSGVTFSSAASAGAALSLGNIAPGQVKAVWIKRSAANSGPLDSDGLTLEIDFDTQE